MAIRIRRTSEEVDEREAELASVFEIPVSLIDVVFILMIFFVLLQVEIKEKAEAAKNLAEITIPTVANKEENRDAFKASLFIAVIRVKSDTRFVLLHNQLTDSLGDKSQRGLYKNLFKPAQWPSLENPGQGVVDAIGVFYQYYGNDPRGSSLSRDELQARFEKLGRFLNGANARHMSYKMKIIIQPEPTVPYKDVMDLYAMCIRGSENGGLNQPPMNIHFMGGTLSSIQKEKFVTFSDEEEEE